MGNVSTQVVIGYFDLLIYDLGPSINDITHLGGGGSAKRWHYYISLFSKMGDKRAWKVRTLKNWLMLFLDGFFEKNLKKNDVFNYPVTNQLR